MKKKPEEHPLPWFYRVDDVLVRFTETADGGMDVERFSPGEGFVRDMSYTARIFDVDHGDAEQLTEEQFLAAIAQASVSEP
jgi:hypothetical protein